MYTGMILIDLQKAFNTIGHKFLHDKLLPVGFSNNSIVWHEFYLAEWHFTVEVANQASKFVNISCGVLQSLVLDPALFEFCQWYRPSCRMWLVLICRWFMLALPAQECHWNKKIVKRRLQQYLWLVCRQ